MSEEFYSLISDDDDVLLFDGNTFTGGKFKQLIHEQFTSRFLAWNGYLRPAGGYIIKQDWCGLSFPSVSLDFKDIQLKLVRECKLLAVGFKGWEKGRIRISSYIQQPGGNKAVIQIDLEFCPDEPDESLFILDELDEIRQSEEYKRLSNQEVKEDN